MSEHNVGLFATDLPKLKLKIVEAIAEIDARSAERKQQLLDSSNSHEEWKKKGWWYRLTHPWVPPIYDIYSAHREQQARSMLIDVVHMIHLNPDNITLTADTCWHIQYFHECYADRRNN